MLNKSQIELIPERIYQRLNAINTEYLVSIGEVIKDIGELRPTDIHQLQQMYNFGAQTDKMAKQLAEATEKNIDDIYKLFDAVAKDNYTFAKPFYEAKLIDYIPYEQNIPLQQKVNAMAKQTVDEYVNLSQHTAFAVFAKDGKSIAPYFAANKDKIATSTSEIYTKISDYAITQVQLGMESYSKAVKDIIKSVCASGIRSVDYATGYSRRLDTAVRQNVLWAVKECNQQTANLIGEQFGSDGREVDYHMYPRPRHEDMGGRQFALGKARTVNGTYYHSFEEEAAPLLAEYGCLHFSFPIILGVSQPAYSERELEQYAKSDNATFEFEGKRYTMYEGTQLQRKTETALRHQRDILNMAKAAGDGDTELIARTNIRMLTDKYAELSKVSGLPTQLERTRSAITVKSVDKSRGSGIINNYKGKGIRVLGQSNISSDTQKLIVEATKKITSDFKILEKYMEPITFGDVNGSPAKNSFIFNTGRNSITLRHNDFSNPSQLLKRLKEDYKKSLSYDTDYIESLVAHEMGHGAHVALALKRGNIPYGEPLTPLRVEIFEKTYEDIAQEIYEVCFGNESFLEIQDICTRELGNCTFGNSHELIAQSFGNYYYGSKKSKVAKKIVNYFKKGLK